MSQDPPGTFWAKVASRAAGYDRRQPVAPDGEFWPAVVRRADAIIGPPRGDGAPGPGAALPAPPTPSGAASPAAPVVIRALGPVGATGPDGSERPLSASARKLLSAFVAAGPEGASPDLLADELWGEQLPSKWRSGLRMAITRLRKALGADVISGGGGRYRLVVPIDSVDLWWLAGLSSDHRPVTTADLQRSLRGRAFADVDAGDLVNRATLRGAAAQTEVALRFCASATKPSESTVALLTSHQREVDPFNERLVEAIGRCLMAEGMATAATAYLDAVLHSFETDLAARPADLVQLRADAAALVESAAAGPAAAPLAERGHRDAPAVTIGPISPERRVPALLEHLLLDPCRGRESELAELVSRRSMVLTGPTGAGRSTLLANVALAAVASGDAVHYVGADRSATPYGPFLIAFPHLRETLVLHGPAGPYRFDAVDDPAELHRAAEAVRSVATLDHLDTLAVEGRLWLLVDDVDGFDSASKRLVGFLARALAASSIVMIVAGRSDAGDEEWARLGPELRGLGFGELTLGPLGVAGLEGLLDDANLSLTVEARAGLARDLVALNGTLPAVARSLIGTIDPETLTFDPLISTYEPERWVQPTVGLSRDAIDVAVGAAVLGASFSVSDLLDLLDLDEATVTDALEHLWTIGHLTDSDDDPDRLQFASALVRDAFLRAAPRFKLLRLNASAAGMTDDLHAVAMHQAAAVPVVDAATAATSLVESARRYMQTGSWRDAVRQLRTAETTVEGDLDVPTLIMMARALDRSGIGGVGPRRRAFERASSRGHWVAALEAALSGLPEAELPDGDRTRIEMLLKIPSDGIGRDHAFDRAVALTRQYALDGQPDEAARWAAETARLAVETGRVAAAEIARWSAAHHMTPGGHAFPDDVLADAGPVDRMRILQLQAIAAVERGDRAAGDRFHRAFADLADELGDPSRIWQAKLFEAMLEFDRGRWATSADIAEHAEQYGVRHGMQQARIVRQGELFHRLWTMGRHGDLVGRVHSMRADVGGSSIAGAGAALIVAANGDHAEAWRRAEPMIRDALARPRSPAVVVLGMLAELVGRSADPELRAEVEARLEPFGDTSLVLGYGIGCLGPVWRQLALLSIDTDERDHRLQRAVAAADAAGALTWRVVARVALARATRRSDAVADAAELAAGTELHVLVESERRRIR